MDQNFLHITRFPTHEVIVGDRPLGDHNPLRLQSMTNTHTMDVKATVAQSIRIIEAGADYVRISTPNKESAEKLKEIKKQIRNSGFSQPLIADVHFKPEVALLAARLVEKVRINPGNYTKSPPGYQSQGQDAEKDAIAKRLRPLLQTCREYGTAIRIGTNFGSLSPRMVEKYGNTPQAMIEATFEFLQIIQQENFQNLVISLKASNPKVMIEAYEGMVKKMLDHQMTYPLHIGITEAGEGENGRIKSALGITSLLNKGIGDTIRVSLTEAPENEIPFATKLSSLYQIPFTEKHNCSFELKELTPAKKQLTLFDKQTKAIVVEDYEKACIQPYPEKGLISYHEDPETVSQTAETFPDIYYTSNPQLPAANPEKKFLIPHNKGFKKTLSNIFPLIEHGDNLWKDNSFPGNCFVVVNNSRQSRDISFQAGSSPAGIIVDMDNCPKSTIPQSWINFAQKNEIPLIIKKEFNTRDTSEMICHAAMLVGEYLLESKIQGLWISSPKIRESNRELIFGFLQSAGLRITQTEYISCPTCSRTSYDLQSLLKDLQQNTSGIPGIKIAVMGCVVNGPGEMADADFGFVGTAHGKVHLYQKKHPIIKNIEPRKACSVLLKVLKEQGYM